METWRIIATALLGLAGIVGMLLVMAKVRERTGNGGTVAISGAVSFTALVVLGLLTLSVLAPVLTWAVVGIVGIAVTVALLAS